MFNLSQERDKKTVETIQEVFDKFTTDLWLLEMRHTHNTHTHTHTHEMISMRMCEVVPK